MGWFEIIFILLALLLGAWLYSRFQDMMTVWRMRKISRQGKKGELKAWKALEKLGYKVLQEQARMESTMLVNGKKMPYNIIGDFLVEKGGKKSIVEVKTGSRAPDPTNSATRRQLLEYAVSYPIDSIMLFDAQVGELKKIEFPSLESFSGGEVKKSRGSILGVSVVFLTGMAAGYWLSI